MSVLEMPATPIDPEELEPEPMQTNWPSEFLRFLASSRFSENVENRFPSDKRFLTIFLREKPDFY